MNKIRYIEICVGLGLGLGPFLGSLVYAHLQYDGTIYLFGVLNLFGLLASWLLIPAELNATDKVQDEDAEEDEEDVLNSMRRQNNTISWGRILGTKGASFAYLTCFFGTFAVIDYVGFIATELVHAKGMGDEQIGYLFFGQCMLYLFMCLIYPYVFEHSSRKMQFVVAMFGMGCCHLLMGPSNLLAMPDELWIIITGMCLIGLF